MKYTLKRLGVLLLVLALLFSCGCGAEPVPGESSTPTTLTDGTTLPSVTDPEPSSSEAPSEQTDPPTTAPTTEPVTLAPTETTGTTPTETAPQSTTEPSVPEISVVTPPDYRPPVTQPVQPEPETSNTEPAPTVTEPTYTEPAYTEPVYTEPAPTEPEPTETAPTEPATEAPTQPPETTPPSKPEPTPRPEPEQPTSGSFKIHFIDVGQADAALIQCDGQNLLIDGGNAGDSNLMYTYLKKQGVTHLDYVIGTHAHEDHIGGVAGALNYADAAVAYCPVTSYNSKAFSNFAKAVQKHGISLTVPSVGDQFRLGSATCRIIGVNSDSDPNNTSIVVRIVYGNTSFLFTGDAEREAENIILNSGYELRSTVLKVGHHGSSTSTGYQWLREVDPDYAVISVGKDNTYGHPTEATLSRLRDADVTTFRTDMQGDIICTSDGTTVTFTTDRNANADTFGGIGGNSTQTKPDDSTSSGGTAMDYVLNTNSKKFHEPTCHSAAKISNKNRKNYHGTREDLIAQGYDPCGNCDP